MVAIVLNNDDRLEPPVNHRLSYEVALKLMSVADISTRMPDDGLTRACDLRLLALFESSVYE